ncbi:MAG TPA: choice-of-anchor tandem repeat GloVer-containing protein, partial [Nevskia sp.]|nr:choice-of-anchor tandem repeat GloVer-containing protein [Nevskia sp.]
MFPQEKPSGGNGHFTLCNGGKARKGSLRRSVQAGGIIAAAAFMLGLPAFPAQAAEEVLYSFPNATGGTLIYGGVARAANGTVYAVSSGGGQFGSGELFKVSPTGTYTPVHDFGNIATDGTTPYGTPIFGSDGNLYGTTRDGGGASCGV